MLTQTITEKEIAENILKGKYKTSQLKSFVKYTVYSQETYELFENDVLYMLKNDYKFYPSQCEIIFNRGWADCSSGGLKSVLDEVVDLARFSEELMQA